MPQESSWDPPPEWQGAPATWGADYQRENLGIGGFTTGGGDGGSGEQYDGGEGSYDENGNYAPREGDYASSVSAANSVAYDPSGTGQTEGGRYGDATSTDATGRGPADETATAAPGKSSQPSTKSFVQGSGSSAGSGAGGRPSGGSRGDDDSSGGSSLDRTSADELGRWSLEKLREVSKVKERRSLSANNFLSGSRVLVHARERLCYLEDKIKRDGTLFVPINPTA